MRSSKCAQTKLVYQRLFHGPYNRLFISEETVKVHVKHIGSDAGDRDCGPARHYSTLRRCATQKWHGSITKSGDFVQASESLSLGEEVLCKILFCAFPGGITGISLLVVRAVLGVAVVVEGGFYISESNVVAWCLGLAAIVAGSLLVVGLFTPFASPGRRRLRCAFPPSSLHSQSVRYRADRHLRANDDSCGCRSRSGTIFRRRARVRPARDHHSTSRVSIRSSSSPASMAGVNLQSKISRSPALQYGLAVTSFSFGGLSRIGTKICAKEYLSLSVPARPRIDSNY